MHSERPFELFSTTHIGIILFLSIVGMFGIWCIRRFVPKTRLHILELFFAFWIVLQFGLERIAYLYLGGYSWHEVLPLQLCGASIILTAWLMITHNRYVFEVLYFWALLGATMGMLMPEVEYDFPHPFFLTFFTYHFYPVYAVFYFIYVHKYTPQKGALARACLITNCYMAFIAIVNLALGSNYLFICAKPTGSGILDFFGPWPVYIIVMELCGILAAFIVYLPFKLFTQKNPHSSGIYGTHNDCELT